jgi:hypothetical protein
MGEWSKKIGEYGEEVVELFFTVIGWNDLTKGVDIPCINQDKHKNKSGNSRSSHGIDFLYSYINPLVNGELKNILVSSKFKTAKYPNSPSSQFREYMEDLIVALECYEYSERKQSMASSFNHSTTNDVGVLFWLNNASDSSDDLINAVSTVRTLETQMNSTIFIMDNKRVAFILEVMKYIKTKSDKYDYDFYYPNTGKNINPLQRENVGKRLPVEFLNSSIIPIKLVNKDNPKEITWFLATSDDFEENDLMRLMGLAKDITTELVSQITIAFPDYEKIKHEEMVTSAKQKFQSNEFTKNVKVINFLNPITSFKS